MSEAAAGGRQAARSEATRAKLVEVGIDLFSERGYAGVGTEEIVERAQVTRGALYHHFGDKRDLFRAVHEELEALGVAASAVLDVAMDRKVARVTLIDAPSVLGWEEWREIDTRYGLGLTEGVLTAAMDAGRMARQPVRPLAHLLVAALGEAAIMVATANSPAKARAEVEPAVQGLLQALVT